MIYLAKIKPNSKDIYGNDLTDLCEYQFDIQEIHKDITYLSNHMTKATIKLKTKYVEFIKMP